MKSSQTMYLKPEAILRYLEGNETLHTLITTQAELINLITTDQALYEAIGSIENRSSINWNLLVKMLEVVTIQSYKDQQQQERTILTPQRVEELRGLSKQ